MYPLRRISQNTKYLKNYIYTSSVNCKNFKETDQYSKKRKVSKKSKESLKHSNVETPRTGLENFFESASTKKALNSAVESVAQELSENTQAVKHDLMQYIKQLQVTKGKPKTSLYKDKSEQIPDAGTESSIFSNVESLNIFKNLDTSPLNNKVKLNIWDNLEQEELEYLGKTHPRNHFEELINWTKEGRMWHFPIDNEQGLDDEAKVNFSQHVFLEQHLEPWCPKKGPLRRFMDLVLTGLGKNPYLSVEEKKEHINWFQEYFEKKKKLLTEVGAVDSQKEIEAPTSEIKS